MTLTALMDALRDSPAFQHKQDIVPMLRDLEAAHGAVPVGDDCAVLADGDGYLAAGCQDGAVVADGRATRVALMAPASSRRRGRTSHSLRSSPCRVSMG